MKINQLKKLLYSFGENLHFEYDLKKKNWFNIGGKSKVFFQANNLTQLINLLKILNNQERIFILGAGSNILITDDLFDGVNSDLKKEVRIETPIILVFPETFLTAFNASKPELTCIVQ